MGGNSPSATLAQIISSVAAKNAGGPIRIRLLVEELGPRGPATLILLFALPMALPLMLPGIGTPFGIMTGAVGGQLGWRSRLWLPQAILDRTLSAESLVKIATHVEKAERLLAKFTRPRLRGFVSSTWSLRFTGVLILICSVVMVIPLPLPFTNMLPSVPMVVMAAAILGFDGWMLLAGYLLALLGLSIYATIVILAWQELESWLALAN